MICPGCGQPWIEAWNPDSEGYYEVTEDECFACAELERHEKQNKDADHRRDLHVMVAARLDHPHEKLKPWTRGT